MIKKSLVINDDAISLLIASKMLKNAGGAGKIVTTDNGKNALGYFSEIIGKGEDCFEQAPESVFLDLYMLIMNGWDFLKIFSEKYASLFPATMVVIASSTADREDLIQLEKYVVVSDFICTPMTLEKLEDIKKRYILIVEMAIAALHHQLQVN